MTTPSGTSAGDQGVRSQVLGVQGGCHDGDGYLHQRRHGRVPVPPPEAYGHPSGNPGMPGVQSQTDSRDFDSIGQKASLLSVRAPGDPSDTLSVRSRRRTPRTSFAFLFRRLAHALCQQLGQDRVHYSRQPRGPTARHSVVPIFPSDEKTRYSLMHAQETIELEGSVRSLTRRLITVANPLGSNEPITFPKRSPADGLGSATGDGGESEVRRAG